MKKMKRMMSLLLVFVMALSLLTGCAVRAAGHSPAELPAQTLTAEEAQAIALNHAGFAADQVRFLRTDPELRDRVPHYDVEFREGRWEYEYEIHAETGRILSYNMDD